MSVTGAAEAWQRLETARSQPSPQALLLCASHRLALRWQAEDARRQQAAGRAAWRALPVMAVDRFLRETYERAVIAAAAQGRTLPFVLEASQERALWRGIVEEAAQAKLLRGGEAARLAASAWRLARDWRIPVPIGADGNTDVSQFNDWAARFQRRLRALGAVDAAGLPATLAAAARDGTASFPPTLLLAGFAALTPALEDLLDVLAGQGVTIQRIETQPGPARVERVVAADAERELRAAASWTRDALAAGATRVGVIVADLQARRALAQRVFAETLSPRQFGVGLGEPLAEHSMIQAAMRLLSLRAGAQPLDELSALLLSPYWGGDEIARDGRGRVDLRLRQEGYLQADLADLARVAERLGESAFAQTARSLLMLRVREPSLNTAAWAQRFSAWLTSAGWPGARAADAVEQDLRRRWSELLIEFTAVGAVLPTLPQARALMQLRDLAEHTLLPDRAALAPVQILAPRDSAGLDFDRLWVAGLDDQRWPPPARPSPLLPFGLQRSLGMPGADAAHELEEAARLTQAWARAAAEVVFSHSQHEEDRELQPSPLLPDVAERPLEAPQLPASWTQVYAARRLEALDDRNGAPAPAESLRGGTRLFADQAACPFRAYARHRLGAEEVEDPTFGPDAREQGILTHDALHELWSDLRGHAALVALDDASRLARVEAAVDRALQRFAQRSRQRLGPAMAQLERRRLVTLLNRWLQLERDRPPFEVLEVEGRAPGTREVPRKSAFEGVSVTMRPDRIDRLPDGTALVLDYKTGEAKDRPWSDARPQAPQLLLYALDRKDVAGVAFAQVRTGELELRGVADSDRVPEAIESYANDPKLTDLRSWQDVLTAWRERIALLGTEIREGFAGVLPLKPDVCKNCDVHAVCRVRESVFDAAGDDADAP